MLIARDDTLLLDAHPCRDALLPGLCRQEGDAPGLAALDAARLRLLLLPSGDPLDEDAVVRG
jgi:hypothetical protein